MKELAGIPEIAALVQEETHWPKPVSRRAIQAVFGAIKTLMLQGKFIRIIGLGEFGHVMTRPSKRFDFYRERFMDYPSSPLPKMVFSVNFKEEFRAAVRKVIAARAEQEALEKILEESNA